MYFPDVVPSTKVNLQRELSYTRHCFKGNRCIEGILEWIYNASLTLADILHYSHTHTHTHTQNVKHTDLHIEAYLNSQTVKKDVGTESVL